MVGREWDRRSESSVGAETAAEGGHGRASPPAVRAAGWSGGPAGGPAYALAQRTLIATAPARSLPSNALTYQPRGCWPFTAALPAALAGRDWRAANAGT